LWRLHNAVADLFPLFGAHDRHPVTNPNGFTKRLAKLLTLQVSINRRTLFFSQLLPYALPVFPPISIALRESDHCTFANANLNSN
jgi:hypothetical protein